MIARHDGDQRLLQNQLERQIRVRLVTQEGDVDKAMSTLPCFRSSASVTENQLDTRISILGSSSRRIRVADPSQAAPVQ